jgi:hypothetical protein
MSRFKRGSGLVIIAAALAGCGSSHPAGVVIDVSHVAAW